MRNKFPSFIALLCIFVYAGVVVFGAYRLYTSIQSRRALAVRELDAIENLITQRGSLFYTEPFRGELRKRLTESSALQGIIITGSQGNFDFEKEPGRVIAKTPHLRFIPRFGHTTLAPRPLSIPGSRNVQLYATLNAVNYEYAAHVLRQTLIAVLGALLLSFLTMMITMLVSNAPAGHKDHTKNKSTEDETGGLDSPEQDFLDDDFFDIGAEAESGLKAGGDEFAGEVSGDFSDPLLDNSTEETLDGGFELPDFDDFTGLDDAEQDGVSKDDFTTNDFTSDDFKNDGFQLNDFLDEGDLNLPEFNNDESPETLSEDLSELDLREPDDLAPDFLEPDAYETADTAHPSSGGADPKGLYSHRSNIGWEAYTRDRLDSELHICASSEQDLVVLLAECGDGVNCDEELYRQIADTAVELFNLRDLTFEYGERGITVIIPNTGLEQGISKAEAFHARLFKNHPGSFHAKNDLLAGLSSRSGRLIEADRLILEASRALEKAKVEAGSPIVAFKSDPEKYREYLQKESP